MRWLSLRPAALGTLALAATLLGQAAHAVESLEDYVAAMAREAQAGPAPALGKPAALDVARLLRQSHAFLHKATPAQTQRLHDAFQALIARHMVPYYVSPIPAPQDYLAFTEMHIAYAELLDRATQLQRAGWMASDKALLETVFSRLCTAPSIIDFHRRGLDAEIAAGRYPAGSVQQARAVSERLKQRTAWYSGSENQASCRNLPEVKVAP